MRRTKDDAEQTREEILNAATYVFGEKGFSRSTLDEIAKKANVTRGAIYWHFKNKGEIFDAIHTRLHHDFMSIVKDTLSVKSANPVEQLKKLCIQLMQDLEHDELKKQAVILFLIKTDYSGELAIYKEKHRKDKTESMVIFQNSFISGMAKNIISKNYDPEALSLSVVCLMRGMLLEYLLQPEYFDINTRSEQIFNILFDNL